MVGQSCTSSAKAPGYPIPFDVAEVFSGTRRTVSVVWTGLSGVGVRFVDERQSPLDLKPKCFGRRHSYVGAEGDIESVADKGHGADDGINQRVADHTPERELRHAELARLPDEEPSPAAATPGEAGLCDRCACSRQSPHHPG